MGFDEVYEFCDYENNWKKIKRSFWKYFHFTY